MVSQRVDTSNEYTLYSWLELLIVFENLKNVSLLSLCCKMRLLEDFLNTVDMKLATFLVGEVGKVIQLMLLGLDNVLKMMIGTVVEGDAMITKLAVNVLKTTRQNAQEGSQ